MVHVLKVTSVGVYMKSQVRPFPQTWRDRNSVLEKARLNCKIKYFPKVYL